VNRIRVLLADDNQPVLARVAELLAVDFEVVGAVADGVALLEAVAALQPDICVVDLCMPVMNGIEATRKLREVQPDLPVIILTAHDDEPSIRCARSAGACGYVVKARILMDLAPAIREVLAGRDFVSPAVG